MEEGTMTLFRWPADSPADISDVPHTTCKHYHKCTAHLSGLPCPKCPAMGLFWTTWNKPSLRLFGTHNWVASSLDWVLCHFIFNDRKVCVSEHSIRLDLLNIYYSHFEQRHVCSSRKSPRGLHVKAGGAKPTWASVSPWIQFNSILFL